MLEQADWQEQRRPEPKGNYNNKTRLERQLQTGDTNLVGVLVDEGGEGCDIAAAAVLLNLTVLEELQTVNQVHVLANERVLRG